MIIARAYCHGHLDNSLLVPCPLCLNRASAALQELAGQGVLLSVAPDPSPLSDPDANTPGKAKRGASDTQTAARWAILPKSGTRRRQVLAKFFERPRSGWTDAELITELGTQSARPRRIELTEGGWLLDTGERRDTPAGLPAIVWGLTFKAFNHREEVGA